MSTTSTDTPALSHLDETGQVRMVDVGGKASTPRIAIAEGRVRMSPAAYKLLSAQANAKGEVLNTARVAGILAAKRCAELIDRKSTRLNSSHSCASRMPASA